ncbi:hypothetical protein H4R22_000130 [Coemansia sp. RSA 1290]|nr:hypothetical protein H4R22_000130 [Coemansia sp. RSA 1290]
MGSDDTGTAKTLAQRQAMRRQAPYAQRRIRSQRSSSFADNIMSICEQLSKPLFGRSLNSPRNQDAFSVPWRTVDRETMELRQQLERSEESLAATEKSEPVSPYESVFETARKIASARAQEQDNSPTAVSKGKEPEVVGFEDYDEEEDEDFVPSDEAKDDDEEEELERQLEPIDESEEVIEPSKPSTAPYETESSPQEQSAEEDLKVSVIADEGESEAVEPDEVEEASESEAVEPDEAEEASESEVAASEEEHAELSSEDEVQISIEESESEESDQATEELASIASAESVSLGEESEADESTQPVPESPAEPAEAVEPEPPAEPFEPVDDAEPATPAQSNLVQQTPTSRKWWPFSGSSFLGSLLNTEQRKGKRSLQESEPAASESPVVSPTFGQRRALPKHSSGRLFVPSSFIDVAKETPADSGKRARASGRSALKRNALLENRRHTTVLPTQPTPVSSATVSTDTISAPPKRPSRKQSTPLITAASLGLEGRRNAARGHSGQQRQQRRRTCLYYGSGYGSSSTPYVFDTMRSALVDANRRKSVAHAPADQELVSNTATTEGSGIRSSTTAQRILDIIGDVPPTRSQAGLDAQGTANPYELSSPYSVRMQLKSTQRRRVLVPLSTRLSQPAEPKSSSEQRSSKAILESIQSAAPPEIQAKLGSAPSLVAKKPELPKAPQFKAISASSKPTVDMTPPPPTQTQITTPATSAAVMKPIAAMSTPTKSLALSPKQFSFTLPPLSTPDSGLCKAVKLRVANLPVAELPTFVFTLSEQQSAPDAVKPVAAAPATEWTCELCDLKSPDSASKCVVCDADRPAPKPATKPATSKSAPATANSKEWECSVCELKSPASAEKCIVCDSPRPAGSTTASASKPAPAPSAAQEWECKVCELKNPPSAKDCTVCDAPKPVASSVVPNPAGPTAASASKPAPAPSAAQEWECKVCELKNPSSAKDCTVCDAPKPEQAVATAASQSFAALAKAPKASDSEWTCELCDLKSPESASKCIVCDAPKPGSKPTVAAPQSKPTPSFAFGLDVTKKPAVPASWASSKLSMRPSHDQWECDICELKNQASDVKCTVCDAARPAAAAAAASVQPAPAVASKQTANASLPVFEFNLDVSQKPLPPQQRI